MLFRSAELKLEAKRIGFHCRSWVIWYYTFGVNCVKGFSRSHTHLFHFVKHPKRFTFNRFNPQIRVQSARQLVYADLRANPNGRLPDNTWITRPQDAPQSFSPMHDTWYYARVAGTFKEREGFHGCQMPEQLLARIIRASSNPQDLVLDPFGGSGTTLCVAKKLGRQFMGFELSEDYAERIQARLEKTQVGDPLDGHEDPVASAPTTSEGKKRPKGFEPEIEYKVKRSFESTHEGYDLEYVLCDQELNNAFVAECQRFGGGGNAHGWNAYALELLQAGKLAKPTKETPSLDRDEEDQISAAAEVAWRLLGIDYAKTWDGILCSPDFAVEFDRIAQLYCPEKFRGGTSHYRLAACGIRKLANSARIAGLREEKAWLRTHKKIGRAHV